MDGRTNGWTDRWMDRWMDKQKISPFHRSFSPIGAAAQKRKIGDRIKPEVTASMVKVSHCLDIYEANERKTWGSSTVSIIRFA